MKAKAKTPKKSKGKIKTKAEVKIGSMKKKPAKSTKKPIARKKKESITDQIFRPGELTTTYSDSSTEVSEWGRFDSNGNYVKPNNIPMPHIGTPSEDFDNATHQGKPTSVGTIIKVSFQQIGNFFGKLFGKR